MDIDPLKQPKLELKAAAINIQEMKNSPSFDEFERHWKSFLGCLEKVWSKTERSCQEKRAQFQPWQGKFSQLRKKDMLLRYLKQARDADTHSVQELTEIYPGHTAYRSAKNSSHYIKKMVINNGVVTHYEGDPMIEETVLSHPRAVKVKNNGEWYNPPTVHLGKNIKNQHPVTSAEFGLIFYNDFLIQVEDKFFSKN